jgi:hypothetical protein
MHTFFAFFDFFGAGFSASSSFPPLLFLLCDFPFPAAAFSFVDCVPAVDPALPLALPLVLPLAGENSRSPFE